MPTIAVDKEDLWERLGKVYSACNYNSILLMEGLLTQRTTATEEFDQLCFDYGLELDEDVWSSRYVTWWQFFLRIMTKSASDNRRGGGGKETGITRWTTGVCNHWTLTNCICINIRPSNWKLRYQQIGQHLSNPSRYISYTIQDTTCCV